MPDLGAMRYFSQQRKEKDMSEVIPMLLSASGIALDEIMRSLIIPGNHMMDQTLFKYKIGESMYFLMGNEFLFEPYPEQALKAIREDMEYRFQKGHGCDRDLLFDGQAVMNNLTHDSFMNLLAATIASWCGVEFFDIDLPLEYIAQQSIEAAWTRRNEELMRIQWKYMGPVMQEFHKNLTLQ